jgi:hypothetical protein
VPVPIQKSELSCICVVSILPFSTIILHEFDFGTVRQCRIFCFSFSQENEQDFNLMGAFPHFSEFLIKIWKIIPIEKCEYIIKSMQT